MKIFETNSGLGYQEVAFFIICGEGYLAIDTSLHSYNDIYKIGEVYDFEDSELEESNYNIEYCPLKGNYLFEFFLQHFRFSE